MSELQVIDHHYHAPEPCGEDTAVHDAKRMLHQLREKGEYVTDTTPTSVTYWLKDDLDGGYTLREYNFADIDTPDNQLDDQTDALNELNEEKA